MPGPRAYPCLDGPATRTGRASANRAKGRMRGGVLPAAPAHSLGTRDRGSAHAIPTESWTSDQGVVLLGSLSKLRLLTHLSASMTANHEAANEQGHHWGSQTTLAESGQIGKPGAGGKAHGDDERP